MPAPQIVRSLLFVPANRPEFLSKAPAAGPDTIVLDLEDSVPAGAKADARTLAAEALAQRSETLTFVRIQHPDRGEVEADLAVLAPHPNQVVLVPKVRSPDDVRALDAALSDAEARRGLARDSIALTLVIEDCLGLQTLPQILAAAPRVRGASLATAEEGDLMVELGGQWTASGEALHYARGKLVCDARAARLPWIIDGAFMQLDDAAGLEREVRLARTFGFNGKVAIHPRQVATINSGFAPSPQEVERAGALIAAYRAAEAAGQGTARFRDMMIDQANVRRAEQILALGEAAAG